MNETHVWLKIIIRSELVAADRLDSLQDKCDQLCRIAATSIQTAQRDNWN